MLRKYDREFKLEAIRMASESGVTTLAGQAVSLGRINARKALEAVRIVSVGMKPPESSR